MFLMSVLILSWFESGKIKKNDTGKYIDSIQGTYNYRILPVFSVENNLRNV